MVLERGDLVGHVSKVVGIFEIGGTAVGSIDAIQGEVAASLAWGLAIAFDLSSLTFVAWRVSGMVACVVA